MRDIGETTEPSEPAGSARLSGLLVGRKEVGEDVDTTPPPVRGRERD